MPRASILELQQLQAKRSIARPESRGGNEGQEAYTSELRTPEDPLNAKRIVRGTAEIQSQHAVEGRFLTSSSLLTSPRRRHSHMNTNHVDDPVRQAC